MGSFERLLVTGTGRCGTKWMAKALTAACVPCAHERAFNMKHHGEIPWSAEASWPAAAYLSTLNDSDYVVHLVRDPLRTIASRVAWGTFDREHMDPRRALFAFDHCPRILDGETNLERAARHYVEWNQMIEQHRPNERLRIEDATADEVSRIARKLEAVPRVETLRYSLPRHDTNAATPGSLAALSWSDVEAIPGLVDLARRYGYC